jgi:hypothetical protein
MLESVLFRWVDKVVEEKRVAWIIGLIVLSVGGWHARFFVCAFWIVFCCRGTGWYHLFYLIPLHMQLSYFLITIEYPFFSDIYRLAHTQGILNNKANSWFLGFLGASNPQLTKKRFEISFTSSATTLTTSPWNLQNVLIGLAILVIYSRS